MIDKKEQTAPMIIRVFLRNSTFVIWDIKMFKNITPIAMIDGMMSEVELASCSFVFGRP